VKLKPIMIFGPSGGGKTCFAAALSKWLIENKEKLKGKRARLYTAEHYGSVQQYIDDGVIEVWKFNNRDHPWETSQKAMEGYWPSDMEDGIAGLDPTSPLVAPTAQTFEDYPIMIVEGGGTISNYISGDYVIGGLMQQVAAGIRVGRSDDKDGPVTFQDGETAMALMSRGNYGQVQDQMTSLIQRNQKRGGYRIWTSHDSEKEEKRGKIATGRTFLGPQIKGSALAAVIGREFGDVWRITPESNDDKQVTGRYVYLRPYTEDNLTVVCKNSGGEARAAVIKDRVRLTDEKDPTRFRGDAAKTVAEMVGL
jgi:hypothetical protein